jgi:hypothetical protein
VRYLARRYFNFKGGIVRITVLSDHATEQLQKRESARRLRYEEQMHAYEGKLQLRQERINGAGASRRTAWEEGQYAQALLCMVPMVWHRYKKWEEGRIRPVKELPGAEDYIWQQGREGKDSLT